MIDVVCIGVLVLVCVHHARWILPASTPIVLLQLQVCVEAFDAGNWVISRCVRTCNYLGS